MAYLPGFAPSFFPPRLPPGLPISAAAAQNFFATHARQAPLYAPGLAPLTFEYPTRLNGLDDGDSTTTSYPPRLAQSVFIPPRLPPGLSISAAAAQSFWEQCYTKWKQEQARNYWMLEEQKLDVEARRLESQVQTVQYWCNTHDIFSWHPDVENKVLERILHLLRKDYWTNRQEWLHVMEQRFGFRKGETEMRVAENWRVKNLGWTGGLAHAFALQDCLEAVVRENTWRMAEGKADDYVHSWSKERTALFYQHEDCYIDDKDETVRFGKDGFEGGVKQFLQRRYRICGRSFAFRER